MNTKQQNSSFSVSPGLFVDNPICPFCQTPMKFYSNRTVVCENANCPYVCDADVYSVTNALIEAGQDPLSAARLAAEHTGHVTSDDIAPERFAVTDESKANWVLKQMAEAQARIDATQAMIAEEIAAINKRGEEILKPYQGRVEFFQTAFGTQLADWAKQQLDGRKEKSIKLLHGTIGFRKSADKLIIDDESKAIEWALENGYPGAVKYNIGKTEFKKAYLSNIESNPVLQNIAHIDPAHDEFYCKAESPVKK